MQLLSWKDKRMKDIKGCLSHETDEWRTPSKLYNAFMDHGYFDPCPFKAKFDGLQINYYGKKLFVNPPFSQLATWVEWCITQYNNGCEVILLMPSRTDTIYFEKLVLETTPCICFIKGRLHFNDSKKVAPFPTMLVHLRPEHWLQQFCVLNMDDYILKIIYGNR